MEVLRAKRAAFVIATIADIEALPMAMSDNPLLRGCRIPDLMLDSAETKYGYWCTPGYCWLLAH